MRILGTDYAAGRGVLDISIYPNGGATITAKSNKTQSNPLIYEYNRDIYIKFPTGYAMNCWLIGNTSNQESYLPNGAVLVEVTQY